jgi:hypothetical protein
MPERFSVNHEASERKNEQDMRHLRRNFPAALLTALFTAISALALAPSALAVKPEAPVVLEPESIKAETATLEGLLSPQSPGEVGATYQFVYKASTKKECKGPGEVKAEPPGMSLGGEAEPVAQEITGLSSGVEYAVCLVVESTQKEASVSAPATFMTAIKPETPETDRAEPVTGATATLHGVLNPAEGRTEAGSYEFLYRASTTECEGGEATATTSTSGKREAVLTPVAGLLPATRYTFCLRATNAAGESSTGLPVTFETTTAPPTVSDESSSSVGSTEEKVGAEIDPGGSPTSYKVEYGTGDVEEFSTAETSLGAGSAPVSVQRTLTGLTPGAEYHFRVVATNDDGAPVQGEQEQFTTVLPASSRTSALPDGRADELVSPNAASDGNVYVQKPINGVSFDVDSASPFRAAANGESVAFVSEAQPTGGSGSTGEGFGDEFRGTRVVEGWRATDIMAPRRQTTQYEGFSADLSAGVLKMYEPPALTPDAPAECSVLYSRTATDEAFHALFTSTETPGECGSPIYAGISADDSHVIFESEAMLTGNAASAGGGSQYNLYETVGESTYLVNVLPNGESAPPDATFGVSSAFPGGVDLERVGGNFEHVISTDGTRVVWTDLATEPSPEDPTGATRLFVRENVESPAARTVQVDAAVGGGGQYRGASSDDSLIYFTKEEKLYRYELETATTTDLTPAGGVVGVAGVSEDGNEIYPVASTVLTTEANGNGETALAGSCQHVGGASSEEQEGQLPVGQACNLYALQRDGATRFVTTLLPSDDSYEGSQGDLPDAYGDWIGNLSYRTSEVSRDGDMLAFGSRRQLGSYRSAGIREIYLFAPNDAQLLCVSCSPTGQAPDKSPEGYDSEPLDEVYIPVPGAFTTYQYRWLAADGNRVFFDTAQPLVSNAPRRVESVYEWERNGEGSCRQASGCTYLLSGTESTSESFFSDASESGNDVFFTSRSDLTPEDRGENVVLYDARVGGGFSHNSQACTGTGCQGVPPALPAFATPPSATFEGIGNYPPPSTVTRMARRKTAAELKAERLSKALKICRAKRNKRKRALCEKEARKRYGPARKIKKTTRSHRTAGDKRRTK